MAEDDPEFRLMRFSTDELPAPARFDVWRDTLTSKLMRMAIDALGDGPFRAKAALRALPSLRIGVGAVSPQIHHRTREIAQSENDDVALLVNLQGPLVIHRQGVEAALSPGDACLVECREVADYIMAEPGKLLAVRMRRGLLGAFGGHVDKAIGQFIPANTESLRLLISYARGLPQGGWELSPAATQMTTDHIGDLVSLIVGATGDTADIANIRGVAAARLGSAKAYVREHVSSVGLSAETVAAAQDISPRYLRQLFEGEEQTLTGYLLELRLSQAHAMLTSPRFATSPISDIAFDVGFGDLSYFNRVFRRRYDLTPRDVRAAAAGAVRDQE